VTGPPSFLASQGEARELPYHSLYFMLAEALGERVVTADRRPCNGVRGGPLDHLAL
jgi:predicted nucleic acid-binding protein